MNKHENILKRINDLYCVWLYGFNKWTPICYNRHSQWITHHSDVYDGLSIVQSCDQTTFSPNKIFNSLFRSFVLWLASFRIQRQLRPGSRDKREVNTLDSIVKRIDLTSLVDSKWEKNKKKEIFLLEHTWRGVFISSYRFISTSQRITCKWEENKKQTRRRSIIFTWACDMIKSIQFELRQELVLCMLSSHTKKNHPNPVSCSALGQHRSLCFKWRKREKKPKKTEN